jgi:enoyl-CoA hydratase
LSFTCKPLSAQDALRCGLVNEVVPAAELVSRAKQIAQDICEVNYGIMLQVKALIEKQNAVSFDEACKLERKGFLDFISKAKLF